MSEADIDYIKNTVIGSGNGQALCEARFTGATTVVYEEPQTGVGFVTLDGVRTEVWLVPCSV